MCYLPAGVYSVNRTLTLCGAQPFSLTGGGSGFTTLLRWGPQLPPPGATVALLAAVIMASGADQFRLRSKAERAPVSTLDISWLSWAPVVTPGRG
jgi:hypothetical protein